jgi:CubicO group peptidase (beta-lactamase class C family)
VTAATAQQVPDFNDPGRADRVRALGSEVEGIFREFFENRHVPGLSWGVVLDGELILSGAFGTANLEHEIPADTRSVFRIASMSKSFTALAILQLRDQGKLVLDAPASTYLPEMRGMRYPTSDSPEITVRDLMRHAGGFPEDNPWGDRQLADTDADLIELMEVGPSFSRAPGVAYEYSNTGFALLGQIVQRVSGMEFQDYMREHLLGPLGMDATVWEFERADPRHLALGYDWVDEAWEIVPLEHHGSYGAMGGLMTSIEDFARYAALHLQAWPPRDGADDEPLRRSSLREMHQPASFSALQLGFEYPSGRECGATRSYAYGLSWTRDCEGRVMIAHGGGLPGFGSNWIMAPQYGLAVFAFDNRTYAGTSSATLTALDALIVGAELGRRSIPVTPVLADRQMRLVPFLETWNGAEGSDLFADNFFMDNRVQDLVARSAELFGEAGECGDAGPMEPLNRLRGFFTLDCLQRDIQVYFTLSPEHEPKVQQVIMRMVSR